MTAGDAWVICTAIVCATILIMFFRINISKGNRP
jgi:hypothetical protein